MGSLFGVPNFCSASAWKTLKKESWLIFSGDLSSEKHFKFSIELTI